MHLIRHGEILLGRSCTALVVFLAIGCREEHRPLTEVLIDIDAEQQVRAMTDSLHLTVQGTTGLSDLEGDPVTRHAERIKPISFPLRLGVVPLEDDPRRAYIITAKALQNGRMIAQARLISSYVDGKVRYGELLLEDVCLGRECSDLLETCARSDCQSALVSPDLLFVNDPLEQNKGGGRQKPIIVDNDHESGTPGDGDPPRNRPDPDTPPEAPMDGPGNPDMPQPPLSSTSTVDRVDWLLLVDSSRSMVEKQQRFARELPQVVSALSQDPRFAQLRELHLGVITPDMGTPGLSLPPSLNCAGYGDDGRLRSSSGSTTSECAALDLEMQEAPRFLTYTPDDDPTADIVEQGKRFACLAQVGAAGCGNEMQLEAVLKALWPHPMFDIDPATDIPYPEPRVTFYTDDHEASNPERFGHGGPAPRVIDGLEVAYNGGFLQSDPQTGLSLLVIMLVTDEEDCSSATMRHLQMAPYSPEDTYLDSQPPNTRCYFHRDVTDDSGQPYLHPVARYATHLRQLRAGNEHLVLFVPIVGIPPDLVPPAALDMDDATSREALFSRILSDPRMQPELDETGTNLRPVCGAALVDRVAYPARRIVEVARTFGAQGIPLSICDDDFGPGIEVVMNAIASKLGTEYVVP